MIRYISDGLSKSNRQPADAIWISSVFVFKIFERVNAHRH